MESLRQILTFVDIFLLEPLYSSEENNCPIDKVSEAVALRGSYQQTLRPM
jgi:hypothetical protein